ncbi:hypothetical protein LR48_Vigan350s000200 [Vigna angularis]|uniref:Retrotransposon gag domain-containing protein n=1 Tax=Phaseolus angularis TaxID=3914 RepID=A0A0L9T8X2_PHAAN|nr:hypothetical protein LR48_Vigan350s000200 [Vigna angularis]
MEGRNDTVERRTSELKMNMAAIRQDYAAIRQDLQEIMKRLSGRTSNQEGQQSDDSQASVNENKRRQEEEVGEARGERHEGQPSWRTRVELPTFEGFDPMGWIARAETVFETQGVIEEEKVRYQLVYYF